MPSNTFTMRSSHHATGGGAVDHTPPLRRRLFLALVLCFMVVSSYGADVTSNLFAHSKSSALEQQLTLTSSSGMAAHSTSTSSSDPNNVFAVADSAESIRNLQSGRSESSLSTAFNQNRGDDGNMFQVNAMACVVIRYMHVNALGGGVNALGGNYGNVEVYTKQGPLLPSDATNSSVWTNNLPIFAVTRTRRGSTRTLSPVQMYACVCYSTTSTSIDISSTCEYRCAGGSY